MRILQISDTHNLNCYEKNTDCFRDTLLNLSNLHEKLVKLKSEITDPLDFICHCGDITHGGEKEDYQRVHDYLTDLFPEATLVVTPGNHDDGHFVKEVFYPKQPQFLINSQELGDLRILSFDNTNGSHSNGFISEEVSSALLAALREQPKKDTILMCHHHGLEGESPMSPTRVHPLFFKVLAKDNIIGIFTGHTHSSFVGTWCGVPYYTVGSLSFKAQSMENGLLSVDESSCYHLFSYEKGNLTLEKTGDLGYHSHLGTADYP